MNFLKKNGPGLLFCLVIAVPSWFLGKAVPVIGGPVFSILIGMVLTLLIRQKDTVQPGITYTSKKILQAAVVFLGFGMNLTEILAKGRQSLPIIICTISTSLIIAFILYSFETGSEQCHPCRSRLFDLRRFCHRGNSAGHPRNR